MRRYYLACFLSVISMDCGGAFPQPPSRQISASAYARVPRPSEVCSVETQTISTLDIHRLPANKQVAEWRLLAASRCNATLQLEALRQLAWARDPEGHRLSVAALGLHSEHLRAVAAQALFEYAPDSIPGQVEALKAALTEAGTQSRLPIAWALVLIGNRAGVKLLLDAARSQRLVGLVTLDNAPAFDSTALGALMSDEEVLAFARDARPKAGPVVAQLLASRPDPKLATLLLEFAHDPNPDVASAAAPGLLALGPRGNQALNDLLGSRTWPRVLTALRDATGTSGLLLSLAAISDDVETAWLQTQQVMDLIQGPLDKRASGDHDHDIQGVHDPRGADALVAFMKSGPHLHWQTRAAIALSQIGDLRGVDTLAERLRMDPLKIYNEKLNWEEKLTHDDIERVVTATMVAELAQLHPDQRPWIREHAESAIAFWNQERPSPPDEGMRALAAMESRAELSQLRKWSNPRLPLPIVGQNPPMPEEWVIAQSALRYVGWMHDAQSWNVMEADLKRRPKNIDMTMVSLMKRDDLSMLGMTLRALAVGAARGLSEWGDPRAFRPLMAYVEGEKENEQGRMEACAAMAWVATVDDMTQVVDELKKHLGKSDSQRIVRLCLLETLVMRPVAAVAPALLQIMTPDGDFEIWPLVARAIGKAGLSQDIEAKLFEIMTAAAGKTDGEGPEQWLMDGAALALILGGTPNTAKRAIAMYANREQSLLELQKHWYESFDFWSSEDLEQGRIFRWVDNAQAISRVKLGQGRQAWAKILLMRQLDNLLFDKGPHSLTRVALRYHLWQMAKSDDKKKRDGAIGTLEFMREQGVLLALRDATGEVGRLASQAHHRLMNPSPEGLAGIIDTVALGRYRNF